MSSSFITRDSGKRQEYDSGMKRDTQENKPRFDLIFPQGQKYEETLFYRWATLMERGASKYGIRNWEKALGQEEYDRARASLFRHFMQYFLETNDGEDHCSAILFNLNMIEWLKPKVKKQ